MSNKTLGVHRIVCILSALYFDLSELIRVMEYIWFAIFSNVFVYLNSFIIFIPFFFNIFQNQLFLEGFSPFFLIVKQFNLHLLLHKYIWFITIF